MDDAEAVHTSRRGSEVVSADMKESGSMTVSTGQTSVTAPTHSIQTIPPAIGCRGWPPFDVMAARFQTSSAAELGR